ncbi:MAG: alpha/beta hydrolase [Dysgonomonas sp.]|uniref:alpha/beta hydrolase family protein n=1 Tax=Dysgonomonas TaxID=156973 RepID=UPI0033422996
MKFIGLCFCSLIVSNSISADNIQSTKGYKEENVIYYNSDSTLHFGATLTLPEQTKKVPAVILVSGTGKQDRDGTMAGHKMFAEIADYLGRRGIAVLRTDDRGVGETNGEYETATTADFATDALTAVEYLKSRKEIDNKKIGLIGHSEGGAAISIAASESKDIAFMISLAGLATDGLSSLLRQNEDLVEAANIPEYNKRRYNEINSLMFHTAYEYADSDSLEIKLNETFNTWKIKDDEFFKSLNTGGYDHFRFPIYSYVKQAVGPWYRFFIRYNPNTYLSKVTIPVLALNGDKDIMVAADQNLGNFKKYLSHNNDVTTISIPGLNHLFLPCTTCTQQEYSTIKSEFSGETLQLIYNWIEKHI